MRHSDYIKLYGTFTVTVFDCKDGQRKKLFRHTKKNQITDLGRECVLALLLQDAAGDVYQQNPDYNQIWYLAVGDGTIPPQRTDTALVNQLWISHIDRATEYTLTYSPLWEVVINKEIPIGTLDGYNVSEIGLFTKGTGVGTPESRLYARQIHAAVAVTASMLIEYEWRLGVTIQI